MKKVIVGFVVTICFLGFSSLSYLDTTKIGSIGINLPFGWAKQSNPLGEGAQCIQGADNDTSEYGLLFAVKIDVGNCGGSYMTNLVAIIINCSLSLFMALMVGYWLRSNLIMRR